VAGHRPAGIAPTSLSAQIGETQHTIGEILFGRQLKGIDPGAGERLAQGVFARGGNRLKAPAKGSVSGIDEQLLTGFGVLDRDQADIGQTRFERIVHADGDHFVSLRQLRER
jgi:hypothetical protein